MLTVYGIETYEFLNVLYLFFLLQQYLLFTVCVAECEAAEKQGDDEAHTLQVPERSEGKTKRVKGVYLLFTVLKRFLSFMFDVHFTSCNSTYRLRY